MTTLLTLRKWFEVLNLKFAFFVASITLAYVIRIITEVIILVYPIISSQDFFYQIQYDPRIRGRDFQHPC